MQTGPKMGKEPFRCGGLPLQRTLLDFWQWSASDLVVNTTRGILAEYIIACALNLQSAARVEWDAFDLLSTSGLKIEVKSAAYLQSWNQQTLSQIKFRIQPTRALSDGTNIYSVERKRQADLYIFCLLHHQDKATMHPLDMAQWTFYLLAASVLDEQVPAQKSIALSSLLRLRPVQVTYEGLTDAVDTGLNPRAVEVQIPTYAGRE